MREPNGNEPSRTWPGVGTRLLVRSPLIIGLALACWFLLALTGWGHETSPGAQLARDVPWLAVSAATGVGAVAVFCGAVGASVRYSLVGALPALLMVSSYFTDMY